MDVWTLGEKYKAQREDISKLEARIKNLEDYLMSLTKGNKGKKDEDVQDKKTSAPRVRTGRRITKKS
jgi:uncharacterized protein (DUF342 family)